MPLPGLPRYPPHQEKDNASAAEWHSFTEGYVVLVKAYLQLPRQRFDEYLGPSTPLILFLDSYISSTAAAQSADQDVHGRALRKNCFLLLHRVFSHEAYVPNTMLTLEFLGDVASIYSKTSALPGLLEKLWARHNMEARPQCLKVKGALVRQLESGQQDEQCSQRLRRVCALLHSCPSFGHFLMIGSDLLDALLLSWRDTDRHARKKIRTVAYLSLSSLTKGQMPTISLLVDHLYTIKADDEAHGAQDTILVALLSTTPLLRKLQQNSAVEKSGRAKSMVQYLQSLNITPPHRKQATRKADKGKAVVNDEYSHGSFNGGQNYRLSTITEIQDLFPDLGSGFIAKLLDAYQDNIELVTARLLDNSLPPHLLRLDRAEQMEMSEHNEFNFAPELAPPSTPPQSIPRRSVFDNEDLAKLNVKAGNLHKGRREDDLTPHAPDKASILAALAAFDSDDDERDDTFDVADVGGTVDNSEPISDPVDIDRHREANEEALFSAWKSSHKVFERSADIRRSGQRAALRSETGMTDETIEGWAVMLNRDSAKLRRLEARFATFTGEQTQVARSSWRATDKDEEHSDDNEVSRAARSNIRGDDRGEGQGRVRGQGRGSGPRGVGRGRGDVNGETGDKSTQIARQRKDVNKSQRANHNRRQQRAKKVARAGFSG
jgi:activating signal cointegrator complex subunit 2